MMLSVAPQPAEAIGFFPVYFVRHPIAGRVDSELTVGEVFEFSLLKCSIQKYNNFQIDDGVFAQPRQSGWVVCFGGYERKKKRRVTVYAICLAAMLRLAMPGAFFIFLAIFSPRPPLF
jgi:hypothetical protein